MARIRTIKPEFWEDEKIATLPYPCRLFFIGTWNHADDNGVIRGNPSILKSKIFPYDDNLRVNEVSKWIDALVNAQMLVPISYKNESYFVIRTFHSHQKFDARYPNYLIPKEEFELLYSLNGNTPSTQREHAEHTSREREGGREEVEDIPPISPKGEKDKPKWKTNYEVYLQRLRDEYQKIVSDKEWISQQEKFNPGVDIRKSIEKACVNYWATEAGWKKKKRSRITDIDWRSTFANAVSQRTNRVYLNDFLTKHADKYEQKRTNSEQRKLDSMLAIQRCDEEAEQRRKKLEANGTI